MNESSENDPKPDSAAEPSATKQKVAKEQKLHAVMVMVVALLLVAGVLVFIKFRLPERDALPDPQTHVETQEEKDWAPLDQKQHVDRAFSGLAPKMGELFLPVKGLTELQKKQLGPWFSQWVEKDRTALLEAWNKPFISEKIRATGSDRPGILSAFLPLSEYDPQALVVSEGQYQLRLWHKKGQVISFLYLSSPPELMQLKKGAEQLQLNFSSESPIDSVPAVWRHQVQHYNGLRQVRPGVAGGFIPFHQWQLLEQHPWYEAGALIQVQVAEEEIPLTDDPVEEKKIPGYKDYEGIEAWTGSIVVYHAVNGDVAIWSEANKKMAWLPRRQQKVIPAGTYHEFLKVFFRAAMTGIYMTAKIDSTALDTEQWNRGRR